MNTKKILLPVIAVGIMGISFLGVTTANADNTNTPFSGLVDYISQKFNLDKTKVQTVVDEYRTKERQERQAQMQQKEKERLDALVKDGKISNDQETLILNKLSEIRQNNNPQNFGNLTAEERQSQRQKQRDELDAWAKANNIDPTYLRPQQGMGLGGMHRFGEANN